MANQPKRAARKLARVGRTAMRCSCHLCAGSLRRKNDKAALRAASNRAMRAESRAAHLEG